VGNKNSEEVAKWNTAAARERVFKDFCLGLSVCGVPFAGWSWVASAKWVAVQEGASGGFGSDYHLLLLGLPLPYGFSGAKSAATWTGVPDDICPNAIRRERKRGELCRCGGQFVLQSTVRW